MDSNPGPKDDNVFKRTKKKNLPPSKIAYWERKSAYRQLELLSKIPVGERTDKQVEIIKWAEEIIAANCSNKTAKTSNRTGRNANRRKTKITQETLPKAANSEITKSGITVAVIDKGFADGSISVRNWKKVEVALASVFCQVLKENPGPPPSCTDGGWYQGGIKLIVCSDLRSVELYKISISKIGAIWDTAKLEVVSKEDIPYIQRYRTTIPKEPSDPKLIMEMISVSNPELPTEDWKLVRLEERKGDFSKAIFVLNKESQDLLLKSRGVIQYGFSTITLSRFRGSLPERGKLISVSEVSSTLEVDNSQTNREGTVSEKGWGGRVEGMYDQTQ